MNISPILLLFASAIATAQTIVKPSLIESDSAFTTEGKVGTLELRPSSKVEVHKIESGVLNGVHYRFFYTEGSGTFSGTPSNVGHFSEPEESNWHTGCKKDPITDSKVCFMHMKDLWVFASPNSKPSVSIGRGHYPGSTVTIRLDQENPVSNTSKGGGMFSPEASADLVEKLKAAKSVTTRYMQWPYQSWKDETWKVFGFAETLQYITWAVEHIK
jgi:hypothetical protein